MAAKKCVSGHKGCPCGMVCCSVTPERGEEIRKSAEASRGRSMFDNPTPDMDRFHGAMCRCGVPRKASGISKHVNDDGLCTVHPDRSPQPWVEGVSR